MIRTLALAWAVLCVSASLLAYSAALPVKVMPSEKVDDVVAWTGPEYGDPYPDAVTIIPHPNEQYPVYIKRVWLDGRRDGAPIVIPVGGAYTSAGPLCTLIATHTETLYVLGWKN